MVEVIEELRKLSDLTELSFHHDIEYGGVEIYVEFALFRGWDSIKETQVRFNACDIHTNYEGFLRLVDEYKDFLKSYSPMIKEES